VFASLTGDTLNPNTDYHEWKSLLEEAGLCEGRLHDARHTAATVLLLEVPPRTVMSIMGWPSAEMAARYQHITDAIRPEVVELVGHVICQITSSPDSTGLVRVRQEALVALLPIVDIGLAHSEIEALGGLEDAIAHLRAALADGAGWDGAGAVQTTIETETETGDPAAQSDRYRPFRIYPGQSTGGG
jgi:Phage integrase family